MAVITQQRPPTHKRTARARTAWPELVWIPFSVSVVMLAIGLVSLAAGQAFLFPSLAPASVLQAGAPQSRGAKLWNTLAGQLLGIAGAYFAVWVTGAAASPSSISAGYLPAQRLWATVIGAAASLILQKLARAVDPPAAATVLLITLGAFAPTARDFWTLFAGVLILAALGESMRRWRLFQLGLGPSG